MKMYSLMTGEAAILAWIVVAASALAALMVRRQISARDTISLTIEALAGAISVVFAPWSAVPLLVLSGGLYVWIVRGASARIIGGIVGLLLADWWVWIDFNGGTFGTARLAEYNRIYFFAAIVCGSLAGAVSGAVFEAVDGGYIPLLQRPPTIAATPDSIENLTKLTSAVVDRRTKRQDGIEE